MQKPIYVLLLSATLLLVYGFKNKDSIASSGLSIAGKVIDKEGKGIPNVEIKLEGGETLLIAKTDIKGDYHFSNLFKDNYYLVSPGKCKAKSYEPTLLDLVKINHFLFDLNKFDNTHDFVAADIDNSLEVNYLDVLKIKDFLLDKSTLEIKPIITKENLNIRTNQDLKAYSNQYIVEDLQTSVEGFNYMLYNKIEQEKNQENKSLNLYIKNQEVKKGEIIQVPLFTKDYLGILASNFDLTIDNQRLQLINIQSDELDESKYFSEEISKNNSTELHLLEYSVKSKSIFDNGPIYILEFEVINNGKLSDGISISETGEAYDHNYNKYNVGLTFEKVESDDKGDKPLVNQLNQNYPNPFYKETSISFTLKESEEVEIQIVDVQGKIVWTEHKRYDKGNHQVNLTDTHFTSGGGVYKFYLKTNENVFVKSLFRLR